MGALFEIFLIVAFIAFVLAYAAISWGTVFYCFWYWFLLPVFPAMPHITFAQAIGLAFFVSLFKNHATTSVKKEYRDTSDQYTSFITPWLTLFIGWLAFQFIS